MSRRIEILITPDGRTSIQTLGFTGSNCQDATRSLEQALGQRIAEHRTAEFYQVESTHEHRQEQA